MAPAGRPWPAAVEPLALDPGWSVAPPRRGGGRAPCRRLTPWLLTLLLGAPPPASTVEIADGAGPPGQAGTPQTAPARLSEAPFPAPPAAAGGAGSPPASGPEAQTPAAPAVQSPAGATGMATAPATMPDWPSLTELLALPAWLNLQLGVVAAPIANPVGGLTPATNWMQQIEFNAIANTGQARRSERWRELDHWQAHLRLDHYSGSPSFAATVGSLIAPQNMAYPQGLWLSGASLMRRNRSDTFSVTAGLRSLDPDFLEAPVYGSYLFAAINDTLNLNILGLPITPFAAPSVSLRWNTGALGEWRLGTFWLGPQAETASLFGVESGLPALRGTLQILQWSMAPTLAGFDPNRSIRLRDGGSVARQLPPPLLQLGAFRSRIDTLEPPTRALRLGGVGLNHVVYGSLTLPARVPLGLDNRLWGAAQLDLNPGRDGTPLFLGAGWLCQGPLQGRPLDVLALGLAYTAFSSQLLPQLSSQPTLELNYSFTLNNSLSLQPVLQWIMRPTGTAAVAPILTTALQMTLTF